MVEDDFGHESAGPAVRLRRSRRAPRAELGHPRRSAVQYPEHSPLPEIHLPRPSTGESRPEPSARCCPRATTTCTGPLPVTLPEITNERSPSAERSMAPFTIETG